MHFASPSVICGREAEIEGFVPRQYWTVEAEAAAGDGVSFAATLVRLDGTAIGETGMAGEAAAREAAGRIREARFRAVAVERDTLHRPPNPPFATATLQLAAFRRLGLGVGETMAIAQRLYEGVDIGAETTGLITYPRTGSTAMATAAVAQARAVIGKRFGADCVPARPRTFRSKHFRPGARNAQEAHEAIRPTGFGRTPEAVARHLDRDAARLYGLIWRRALASQMAAARVERVRIELAGEDGAVALAAECSAMVFDGHFRLRDPGIRATEGEDAGDADRGLPALEAGQPVTVRAARAERHAAAPPQRHTEAGLVRRLEARGIGRPSTWAAILAVLQARGYAVLHERRLVSTERGRVLAAFLEHGFGRWMDYGFTAAMEDDLDRIAAGGLARQGMLEGFWGPFDAALGAAGGLTRRTVRTAVEARLDGFLFGPDGTDPKRRRCPACGGDTLELKLSRYGPFVGCAEYPDCGYRRSLSAAAAKEDGYAGPRALGADPGTGMAVTLRRGPTGWYVQRGERTGKAKPGRMSLPPPHEPDDIDLGLALRLLALPRRVGLHPETGAPILAGIGRYAARGAQTGHKVGGSREDAVKLTGGICGRTPQLRDKLVELVKAKPGNSGIANCSLVDPENPNHLAALTGRLDLRSAGIATLKRGDFANLGGIGILRLNTNDLTALPAGVFEGLDDTLTQLSLGDNDLQTIPAGVFDPLTGLSILRLNDNDLSSLPPRIFENLTGLGKLHLDSNPGSARFVPTAKAGPAGGFDDVPQGASVTLGAADAAAGYDDPWGSNVEHAWTHVPASTTVTYDADKGANTANPSFTAPAADGTLTFTLTVTGRGAVSSGSVNRHRATADIAVRVAAGPKVAGVAFASEPAGGNQSVYTAGETIEVDLHFDRAVTVDTAGGTPSVALTVGAGSRTAGYLRGSDTRVLTFGYTVQAADMDADGVDLAADSLALNGGTIVGVSDGRAAALGHAALAGGNGQTVNVAGTGGICDRTLQVRDAIVAAVTAASDCSQVTESHLGEIAGRLDVSAQVSKHGRMAALKAGDFNSLIKVTALDLDNHAIRVFPAGIFGPLTALTELSIAYNQTQAADRLTTLPAGPFEGLTNLTTLRLEHNDLETLPDRIFQPLTNLTTLTLHGNPGSARFLPVAVAGPEGGIDAKPGEEEVKLGGDAGGPWGNNLIYSWRRAAGTAVDPSAPNIQEPTFTAPALAEAAELEYELTVTARGTSLTATDRVTVRVAAAAAVSSVALSSRPIVDSTYKLGETIQAAAVFSKPVTVTGMPLLALSVGASTQNAIYVAGSSGPRRLVFEYTVQSGDTDTDDGIAIGANSLSLGTDGAIVDADGARAILAHPELAAQSGHKVTGLETDPALTGGICGRTPQLRDKLVELVKAKPGNSGIANCSLVDPENPNHLAALTGRLDLRSAGIATLKRGDFANLGGIGILRLNTNDLTALPAGVFEGLDDTLTQLSLGDNDLQTIPAGVFDPLTGLSILRLNDNDLSSLPPRIFENLTGLGKLHLDSNPGSARFVPTAKAGPAGGFDDVPQGASVTLGAADAAGGYDDPWGSNVEHAWTHVPASTTVTYDADKGANTANPSFTAPAADGTLTFTLTVTGRGAVSSGSVNRHRATSTVSVRVGITPGMQPMPVSAVVDGERLTLTYSEKLQDIDSAAVPAPDKGQVYLAVVSEPWERRTIEPVPPSAVEVKGNERQVILTLVPPAAGYNQVVTLSYFPDNATAESRIRDLGGNLADGFTGLRVRNETLEGTTIQNIALTGAAKTYRIGDTVGIAVTFEEPEDVTGAPTLALEIGAAARKAAYVRGSGSAVLTFEYTVVLNEEDTDGIAVEANGLAVPAGGSTLGSGLRRGRRLRGGELVGARALARRAMPIYLRPFARALPGGFRPYAIAGIPWPGRCRDPPHHRLRHHGVQEDRSHRRSRRADPRQGRALRPLRQDGQLHRDLLRSRA